MSKCPLYAILASISIPEGTRSNEAKDIADTLLLMKTTSRDDYIILQKIIYSFICHFDMKVNRTRKYTGPPLGGELVSSKSRKSVRYNKYDELDPELRSVIWNLIRVVRGQLEI